MKRDHLFHRLLAIAMVLVLLVGIVPVIGSAKNAVTFTKVDNSAVSAGFDRQEVQTSKKDEVQYADTDVVRVSIFLSRNSTLEAGYPIEGIAVSKPAQFYRDSLKQSQNAIQDDIEDIIDAELDVVWNLTLAANVISANVEYGQIEKIAALKGVDSVAVETQYAPAVVETGAGDPNMATSSNMIGSTNAWGAGYTGAGSRIAVIDTGIDSDHQSFNASAFDYSLSLLAEAAGMEVDDYVASLDLLDVEEINTVLQDLNFVKESNNEITAEDLYVSTKIPFGFNYVDEDTDITHDNDAQGEHGSHVEGIAAANAYIANGDGTFSSALDTVKVVGVAPDAQIITMKVFGKGGGAYDSDYMAAIEDAIILGCDAANLSLGSGNPGMSTCDEAYADIMASLSDSGMVVAMSAGNSGTWVEASSNPIGYLYGDDVSMQTNGSPGSYTNSFTVASVENDGYTGAYITIGDKLATYTESSGYKNKPMTTIAGEQAFVYIDSLGTDAEFAAVADELAGAIGICNRGETSFYEKANASAGNGAIATIIVNNQPGVINMDLTDYAHEQPCVSVLQSTGDLLKAVSEEKTVNVGDVPVTYYVGTLTVGEGIESVNYNSEYYTMSDFSSWGVPGSLELKPEITAPGGNIYSVYGSTPEGGGSDQYELMSGTSMASPQVAGMSAVLAQYIRENKLDEKTGMSARYLAQSLLMSTAVPLQDVNSGSYYPVIQQGAGLANVGNAVSADSYLSMAANQNSGAADGKIKAELGDDPDRIGVYTVQFTLNNLTDRELLFDLTADLFTQDMFLYYANGNMSEDELALYMDTLTVALQHTAAWTVDGEPVNPDEHALTGLDFNGDGEVNGSDVTALLEYVAEIRTELSNQENADLDGDEEITSADAYELLKRVSSGAANVPANGSVEVSVTLSLTEDEKAYLDTYYESGAYMEGYIHAVSRPSEEGVAGTSHSIPVLAFYGNWSDASMFDVGSYAEYASGDEVRVPYLGEEAANTYAITYANEPGALYYFGGNPMIPDSTYLPERNAMNSSDTISALNFTAIRNAAASRFTIKSGDELLMEQPLGAVSSAYYYVNGGYWVDTNYSLNLGLSLAGIPDGTALEMALTLAPEYYVDAEGNVDWDALGAGASFTMPVTIDDTAPEINEVSLDLIGNTMTVNAADNQYVAAVVLYTASGSKVLTYTGAQQEIAAGEAADFVLDLTDVNRSTTLVQVFDYAMNVSTYRVETSIGEGDIIPERIAFDLDHNRWVSFTKDSTYKDVAIYETSDLTFYAATMVGDLVFGATDTGDLYVMPVNDLSVMTYVANMGTLIYDMAYNAADSTIYGVTGNYLVTIDKLTGEVAAAAKLPVFTITLACDNNGTFYCAEYNTSTVYSFTLDSLTDPEAPMTQLVDCSDAYRSDAVDDLQSMEIDPNTGLLCWNSYYTVPTQSGAYPFSYYFEIDTTSGKATCYEDLWYELAALVIPAQGATADSWNAPTNQVSGVQISAASATVIKGSSIQLSATVQPWTASDRSVTWSSDDETVATVDANGVVTGVSAGTVTITAAANLDATVSASCEVTVEVLDITLEGTLQDEEGTALIYTWDMANDSTWSVRHNMEDGMSMISATDNENGALYVVDMVPDVNSIHKIDAATGETLETYVNTSTLPLADMTYSSYFSSLYGQDILHAIYYYYLVIMQDPTATSTSVFNLQSYMADYTGGNELVGVASAGYGEYTNGSGTYDAEYIYALDNAGYLWEVALYATPTGFSAGLNFYFTNLLDAGYQLVYDDYYNPLSSLVIGEDGNFYFSAFDGDTNQIYRMSFDPSLDEGLGGFDAVCIGNVGQDVWPATLTAVKVNGEAASSLAAMPRTAHMDAEVVALTTEQLVRKPAAEKAAVRPQVTGSLNAAVYTGDTVTRPEDLVNDTDVLITVNAKDATGADVASHNGKFVVTYDPAVLTYEKATALPAYAVINDSEEGKIIIAYADLNEISAAEVVANLSFTRISEAETEVEVDHEEAGYQETVTVDEFDPCYNGHTPEEDDGDCTTDILCSVCGDVAVEGAAAHTPEKDDGDCTTDILCSVCGEVVEEGADAHTGGTATCEHKAECSVCGTGYGELAEHKLTKVPAKDATTEAEGNKEYYVCQECDQAYWDAEGTKPIEDMDEVVIDKVTDTPDTGDSFRMTLWMSLMVFAAAGMVTVLALQKKRIF